MNADHIADLREFTAAYFSDSTISDGVAEVVFATSTDAEYHRRFVETFRAALSAAEVGDAETSSILRDEVGMDVGNPIVAADFLRAVLETYTVRFAAEAHSKSEED